ncbi:unnamed protein product [Prunus armeniaca]
MKPTAKSFSISVSMMTTSSGAKLLLFYTTGLLVGLRWELICAFLSGLLRSKVLAQRPLQASILLQERPLDGFLRLGPDSLIAIWRGVAILFTFWSARLSGMGFAISFTCSVRLTGMNCACLHFLRPWAEHLLTTA